ncbi:hypothetical protein EKN06_08585 [Croceicoccus ponticola]|uniref:DUF2306 domain-containing protein n=1 Tax=Croceicoccus ponticola TaxID=2217664 RepID=A0A437GXU1_9SPHN|nr:hypothetical protein [Croceicoccus ponticola]RVQ66991.1 hypothetical protein EKN06_08585 [Croceicoccus ponticola]
MATTFGARSAHDAERRFFFVLSTVMSLCIVAGFALNLALGRSTFAVPLVYHLHAVVFFGWVALFMAQAFLIDRNNVHLHRRLGMVAFAWVPLMVVMGIVMSITVMRRTGGPFFFDQNQFLFSNPLHLLCFAGLTYWALKVRRHAGWHRRLLIGGYAVLTGPGLGRLIPLPLAIPHAWHLMLLAIMMFPVAGMIHDKIRKGRVHPAWFWSVGVVLLAQVAADIIAYSPLGIALTEQLLAGTPGSARPMEAFLPPGFAM